jgi:hypothetical protein
MCKSEKVNYFKHNQVLFYKNTFCKFVLRTYYIKVITDKSLIYTLVNRQFDGS